MNRGSVAGRGAIRLALALLLLLAAVLSTGRASAHELKPTIADFTVAEGQLSVEMHLNAEAFVAGLDLDRLADTGGAPQSADYDVLRALEPGELEPMARQFAEEWFETIEVTAGGPVELTLAELVIPATGDVGRARVTLLKASAQLPAQARGISFGWPAGSGGVVLRQNGVKEPYTGYLRGGETSPVIPIAGGAVLSPLQTVAAYVPVGLDHVLRGGADHILFALALFFLSARPSLLVWQAAAVTFGHAAALGLAEFSNFELPRDQVEVLLYGLIVVLAAENVFSRRLHVWRVLVIFGFGLLHGLGAASVLADSGLPQGQLAPALFGFNAGVELAQIAVLLLAYAALGFWFGKRPKYRGRVAIPASFTIAVISAYWLADLVVA